MTQAGALKSSQIEHSEEVAPVASFTTRLTTEQFDALSRCANSISLRFDDPRIVDALIAGGYAQRGVAGVITVTPRGYEYLRSGR